MRVSLIDAERQLSDLVRRAEAGEEIIIDHDSRLAVRLVPVVSAEERQKRWDAMEAVRVEGRRKRLAGEIPFPEEDAARSQDFLYDEDGLPG